MAFASGIAFGLVNTFFSLRTKDGITAAKLSGMVQAIGYSFASLGPLLFGVLHDISGSWTPSLIVLLIGRCVNYNNKFWSRKKYTNIVPLSSKFSNHNCSEI
ncbi:hypothetical protein [Staphylococcus simulans]|uniref:hypothetical protein n=1 Tax=Staphylococcus simulans TaxID=1286 RepID=UPI001A8F6933|nr:hypothetical protein [Staphylococcus simulans]